MFPGKRLIEIYIKNTFNGSSKIKKIISSQLLFFYVLFFSSLLRASS